jgi:hypothetical protein
MYYIYYCRRITDLGLNYLHLYHFMYLCASYGPYNKQ